MRQLSQLETLRDAFAEYLRGLGVFAGVEVLTRSQGDLVAKLKTALGKTGLVAEVFIKSARPTQGQGTLMLLNPVVIGLAFYENVLVNQDPQTGTGKGAFLLVESALVSLRFWKPPGFCGVIVPEPTGPQYGVSAEQPTLLILTLDFSTLVQITVPQP